MGEQSSTVEMGRANGDDPQPVLVDGELDPDRLASLGLGDFRRRPRVPRPSDAGRPTAARS